MAESISVSVRDGNEDILDWVDEKVAEGTFRSRSHAFCLGVRKLQQEGVEDVLV